MDIDKINENSIKMHKIQFYFLEMFCNVPLLPNFIRRKQLFDIFIKETSMMNFMIVQHINSKYLNLSDIPKNEGNLKT